MSYPSPSTRSIMVADMVDRRGFDSQMTVPELLLNLYARVAVDENSCREVRLCHKGLGRQNYQALLIHMAKLLESNTMVSLFFLYQTSVEVEAANAIGNMIRSNVGITTLSFHRMDATHLAPALGRALPENAHVTSLTFFASTFASVQVFQSLAFCLESPSRSSRLTQFSLEGCHLNDECLLSLWQALSTNSMLTKIDFRDMRLTGSDVVKLCHALQLNARSQIHTILLDKNWMQDQGCIAISQWITSRRQSILEASSALSTMPLVLQEISLSYNHIGSAGVLALSDTLLHRGNDGDRSTREVVTCLNLSGNTFTLDDIANLTHALTTASTTTAPLIGNSSGSVAKLVMEDCSLEEAAMLLFAQTLPHMGLTSLNVSGHVVSKTIGQVFVNALQSASCTTLLDLQLDLESNEQKLQLDFFLRLNQAGRYLLRLSYHPQERQLQSQSELIATANVLNAPKCMPCSLWPLVFSRLSKTEIPNHKCDYSYRPRSGVGGVGVDDESRSSAGCQADVIYYMIREKVDLLRLQLPEEDENSEESSIITESSPTSRRKRKRSSRA